MVETAVFGFFHRARPPAPAQASSEEPVPKQAVSVLDLPQASALPRSESIAAAPDELVAPLPARAGVEPVFPPDNPTPALLPTRPEPEPIDVAMERPDGRGKPDALFSATQADQLGLASPEVITLVAQLPGFQAVELDASKSGLYRPFDFRPAPWSGFAYDQASDARTGLAAGTRILTSRGEMEVEKLLPGDTALGLRGPALLPISWIGRAVAEEAPVRIEAGALGPNLPRRALCLAPDQAVFLEAEPVTARTLLNGTTIQSLRGERVDLFHVDVGKPEVLFAEGVPLASGERSSMMSRQ